PVFFSHCSLPTPIPPSFPTRRSSDLGPSRLRVYSEYFRNILFTIALLYHTHNQMSSDSYLFCFDSFQHLIRCRVFDTIRYGNVSDRKSTRLNSSHEWISYAVFCLKKK